EDLLISGVVVEGLDLLVDVLVRRDVAVGEAGGHGVFLSGCAAVDGMAASPGGLPSILFALAMLPAFSTAFTRRRHRACCAPPITVTATGTGTKTYKWYSGTSGSTGSPAHRSAAPPRLQHQRNLHLLGARHDRQLHRR